MRKYFILFFLLLCLTGCSVNDDNSLEIVGNSFGESTNKKENSFEEVSMDNLLKTITSRKSGVYYLGFSSCPWWEDIEPVLNKVSQSLNVTINYVKVKDNDGRSLVTEDEKAILMPYIRNFLLKDNSGNPTIYYPFILVIKDGVIVDSHIGTLDGHNAKEQDLSIKEKLELQSLIEKKLSKLL